MEQEQIDWNSAISLLSDLNYNSLSVNIVEWNKHYNDIDNFISGSLLTNDYLLDLNIDIISILEQLQNNHDKIQLFLEDTGKVKEKLFKINNPTASITILFTIKNKKQLNQTIEFVSNIFKLNNTILNNNVLENFVFNSNDIEPSLRLLFHFQLNYLKYKTKQTNIKSQFIIECFNQHGDILAKTSIDYSVNSELYIKTIDFFNKNYNKFIYFPNQEFIYYNINNINQFDYLKHSLFGIFIQSLCNNEQMNFINVLRQYDKQHLLLNLRHSLKEFT